MTRRVTVVTEHVYSQFMGRQTTPHVYSRSMDWQATLDGYEPGDPIGTGPTEADAIYDLFIQIDEREMDDQDRHEHEMKGRKDPDPDVGYERRRDDAMWDDGNDEPLSDWPSVES